MAEARDDRKGAVLWTGGQRRAVGTQFARGHRQCGCREECPGLAVLRQPGLDILSELGVAATRGGEKGGVLSSRTLESCLADSFEHRLAVGCHSRPPAGIAIVASA